MSEQQSPNRYSPLTDPELAGVEQQARQLSNDSLREEILRLIAEVRRSRAARVASYEQAAAPPGSEEPAFDPDYTPPGGRVTMGEWRAIAARLEAARGPLPGPPHLSPKEQEERRRRWERLRAQMGRDAQTRLAPEQEASLDDLIQAEIQAHRRQRQRKRERRASGR